MRAPAVISKGLFALGLVVGIALGLAITRLAGPLQRDNAEPWQLRHEHRDYYEVAVALEHAHRGDLTVALAKLISLRPATDPVTALAESACRLGGSGYLASTSGIQALRTVTQFTREQGRAGCAEELLPPITTPKPATNEEGKAYAEAQGTLVPTKPPLAEAIQSTRFVAPTQSAQRRFEAISLRSFCAVDRPAIIEVSVVDYLGRGLPGQPIRARWGAQEDTFISGLKGERGLAYADFQMDPDTDYSLDMPAAAEPVATSLRTGICYEGNRESLKSYRVVFAER
ncbi:MAG: hypothetical protein OXG92_08340 [Chloroflexi bacterium]|nr:hypothetical protein [Chloroflexota bacterium]MDE2651716.1 hypothetical protein [Chloroflexota bacterium]